MGEKAAARARFLACAVISSPNGGLPTPADANERQGLGMEGDQCAGAQPELWPALGQPFPSRGGGRGGKQPKRCESWLVVCISASEIWTFLGDNAAQA